jgi:hypothetical protein
MRPARVAKDVLRHPCHASCDLPMIAAASSGLSSSYVRIGLPVAGLIDVMAMKPR